VTRDLRSMSHEQLVAECCYRGAELVIERQRNALAAKRFRRSLEVVWTHFLDANPDDLTSPDEYPDHALVTFEQVAGMVETALASAGEAGTATTVQQGVVHEHATGEAGSAPTVSRRNHDQ
jgi:hypothetical protein